MSKLVKEITEDLVFTRTKKKKLLYVLFRDIVKFFFEYCEIFAKNWNNFHAYSRGQKTSLSKIIVLAFSKR